MSIFSKVKEKILGVSPDDNTPDLSAEAPQFIPSPSLDSPKFSDAHIQMMQRNLEVLSKDTMLHRVENSTLTTQCKEAFKSIIENFYDLNTLMTNNQRTNGIEIAFLKAKIYMFSVMMTTATKIDRMHPEYLEIYELILFQMENRINRTDTADRVGVMTWKSYITSEIVSRKQEAKK